MPAIHGEVLREWRRSRGWDVPEMARRIRQAAGDEPLPVHDALVRMVRRWERGTSGLSERYELLYRKALSEPLEASPTEPSHPLDSGIQPWQLADTLTRSPLSNTAVAFLEESVTSLAARYPFTPRRTSSQVSRQC